MPDRIKKRHVIEKRVNGRSFDETVKQVREAFSDVPGEKLQSLIHKSIAGIRNRKHQSGTARIAHKAERLL